MVVFLIYPNLKLWTIRRFKKRIPSWDIYSFLGYIHKILMENEHRKYGKYIIKDI